MSTDNNNTAVTSVRNTVVTPVRNTVDYTLSEKIRFGVLGLVLVPVRTVLLAGIALYLQRTYFSAI